MLTTDDPTTTAPGDATPVDPLVRTKGLEVGARAAFAEGQQSTLSLGALESDSEILFVGDAGTTEPSRPSRRYGLELANFLALNDAWTLDLDASWSHSRLADNDPVGDFIPGAVETVVAAGLSYPDPSGLFGSLRVRHFGSRPLIEDDSCARRSRRWSTCSSGNARARTSRSHSTFSTCSTRTRATPSTSTPRSSPANPRRSTTFSSIPPNRCKRA